MIRVMKARVRKLLADLQVGPDAKTAGYLPEKMLKILNKKGNFLKILLLSLSFFSFAGEMYGEMTGDVAVAGVGKREEIPVSGEAASRQQDRQNKIIVKSEDFIDNRVKLPEASFFFTLGPALYVNTDSSTAPSPISFSAGAGFDLFNGKFLNFQPKLTFFTGYYLWDGENARPAEVENRTALGLSFLLDLDTTRIFRLKKGIIQFGGGMGFFLRGAVLAGGVSSSDTGSEEGSTAGEDVKSINHWFYKNLNFLYPNLCFSWQHAFTENYLAGLEAKAYFPLGAFLEGRGLDSALVFFGIKISKR